MKHLTRWLIAAALVGGVIGLRQHWAKTPGLIDAFCYLATGFACAVFGAPLAAQWLGITGDHEIAGLGFIIAAFWEPMYRRLTGIFTEGHIFHRRDHY